MRAEAAALGVELEWFQTNHEGALVDAVQGAARAGRRRPGQSRRVRAYQPRACATRSSRCQVPFVEVHLTNIFGREPERRHTVLADLAVAVIAGLGARRVSAWDCGRWWTACVPADRREERQAGVRGAPGGPRGSTRCW